MNKMYAFADAEFFRATLCLRGEERTHVDASPRNAMIPGPGAEHLARAAAEVKNAGARLHAQHATQRGVLLFGERVMDAVFTFADGKNTWDIHYLIPVIGLSLKKDTTRLLFTSVLQFHQGLRTGCGRSGSWAER